MKNAWIVRAACVSCITVALAGALLSDVFTATARADMPGGPPSPPPLPPPDGCSPVGATAVAERIQMHGWSGACGPVMTFPSSSVTIAGGATLTLPATSYSNCGASGGILYNPATQCAYSLLGTFFGGATSRVHARWFATDPTARVVLGYPRSLNQGHQRFDYGLLANNATNFAAVIVGGRAVVTGSPSTRYPIDQLRRDALVNKWLSMPGYTGGGYTNYKRPWGDTGYYSQNGGGFMNGIDGTYIGPGNDGTLAVESEATTAYAVMGAIQDYWIASGSVSGYLKWPRSDNTAIAGGEYATFEGGRVYRSTAGGTRGVEGRILAHYLGLGGPGGALGFPTTEPPTPGGAGFPKAQAFQYGSIAVPGPWVSYVVTGAIHQYWLATGGGSGWLGYPTGNVSAVGDGGWFQTFDHGNVYQRPAPFNGPAFVHGVEGAPLSPILAKYLAFGGPLGFFGYPGTTAPNSGTSVFPRTQNFAKGGWIRAVSPTVATYLGQAPSELWTGRHQHGFPESNNTVDLSWKNNGAPVTLVRRQVNGGEWTTIETLGELEPGVRTEFVDGQASVGAENCYQIVGTDEALPGLPSGVSCTYTRDGREFKAHRVQLRVRVPANVPGADSDAHLAVRLQSSGAAPAGNVTYVDSYVDDLEPGSDVPYDLLLTSPFVGEGISDVSDITQLNIRVVGPGLTSTTDGVCIAELELLVDGHQVFERVYGDTAGTCHPVTYNNWLTTPFAELRSHASWQNLDIPADNQNGGFHGFTPAALISILAARLGHGLALDGRGYLADGDTHRSTRIDDNRLHVELDIKIRNGLVGSIPVTVEFDLALYPQVGVPTPIVVENVDATDDSILPIYFFTTMLGNLEEQVEAAVRNMAGSSAAGVAPNGMRFCFPASGALLPYDEGFENGGLTVCYSGL